MAKSEKDTQEVSPEESKSVAEEQVLAGEVEPAVEDQPTAEDKATYEELEAALLEAQAKVEESINQLLRGRADAENTCKRAERDVENARKFALEKFVNELLPVKDSLELGNTAASAEGADLVKVCEGLDLTLKMFTAALEKVGVEELNPTGEKFNPDVHQAMSMQDVDDAAPNTVINVYQKGFQLNGRLVRPAMVVVAGPKSTGATAGTPPESPQIDEMA